MAVIAAGNESPRTSVSRVSQPAVAAGVGDAATHGAGSDHRDPSAHAATR